MKHLKRESYINIQAWMIMELGLKGNELLIYAIIFGFSQDGESKFTGSCAYLCEWTSSSKQSVFNCLKSLVDKGFIQRFDNVINGVTLVDYRTTKLMGVVNKVDGGSQQSLWGGSQQSLPHNIELDNIDKTIVDKASIKKNEIPSLEEFGKYAMSLQNHFDKPIDKNKIKIKYMAWTENNWQDGNNKKITNWKSKLLNTLQYCLVDQKDIPQNTITKKAL